MSMVTVAMVVLPITPTPAAIPPPRHVSLFEFSASTPPQTSPKSSWFSPNNGRAMNPLVRLPLADTEQEPQHFLRWVVPEIEQDEEQLVFIRPQHRLTSGRTLSRFLFFGGLLERSLQLVELLDLQSRQLLEHPRLRSRFLVLHLLSSSSLILLPSPRISNRL